MDKENKKLIVAVVGNILSQYVTTLKEHRAIADEKFPTKTGYGRENNVVKCSKGIEYAERIMDNLPEVLFRDKEWSRKELISVFHDKDYKKDNLTSGWTYTGDENLIATNVTGVLESMGIRAPEIFTALIGYTTMRAERELLDGKKWQGDVNSGSFGKIGVNYGKPKDFEVLFGTDKTDMVVDLSSTYMILRRNLANKLRRYNGKRQLGEVIVNNALRNFTFGVYPKQYGTLVRAYEPTADYQRAFANFRQECFARDKIRELYEQTNNLDDALDMIS